MSSASTPAQSTPRLRGGFEVDDDGDTPDLGLEEGQDDDVYDVSATADVNGTNVAAENGEHVALDRFPESPSQENGMSHVPQAAQAVDSPANLPSSIISNNVQTASVVPSNGPSSAAQLSSSAADQASAVPKSRLAHDVVGILEDRVKDDPRGETDAWLELIAEYKSRAKDDLVRQTYERYFAVFPLAAEQWCAFLQWEEASDRKYQMEQIFKKALVSVPSVDLFNIYVHYVRRRHSMQTGDTTQAYRAITSTFDFALQNVGADLDSGSMWQEYIDFLKTGPGTLGGTGWQDSQKMDTLRDAYSKALSIPTSALQTLWKEYEAFEMGISKINARKLMQERSPDHMTARSALQHLHTLTRDIDRTSRPRLAPAMGFAGYDEYQHQVRLWKAWLEWEKGDPLILKDDKPDAYFDRVIFVYKQAFMALQFWPEMWYDAAEFCYANGREEQAVSFLNQGISANPESPLLAFKLADNLEASSVADNVNDPGSKSRMTIVREPYDKVLDALYAVEKKTEARMHADLARAEASTASIKPDNADSDDVNASNVTERKAVLDEQLSLIKAGAQVHLDLLGNIISHVWIALMRATRRIQGKGQANEKGPAGFRTIFNEARKRGKLTPEFYVESAHIEWNCYRDPTGTKILERGVRLFPQDSYLPLEYVKHLISKDDVTNARAVFESTVNRFTSTNDPAMMVKIKPLFNFFHDYESKYGELSAVKRLESRMRELFPGDVSLYQFASRSRTPGFDPLSATPIVSLTQMRPSIISSQTKAEEVKTETVPTASFIDHGAYIHSPKRPLPIDDDNEDGRPAKFSRAESPGQSNQMKKVAQPTPLLSRAMPLPPPLPPAIAHILGIIPRASTITDLRFDANAVQKFIREKHLPAPGTITNLRPPPTPQAIGTPTWPPPTAYQPQHIPHIASATQPFGQLGTAPPPPFPPPQYRFT